MVPTAVPMVSPVLLGVSIAFGAPCRARLALVIIVIPFLSLQHSKKGVMARNTSDAWLIFAMAALTLVFYRESLHWFIIMTIRK